MANWETIEGFRLSSQQKRLWRLREAGTALRLDCTILLEGPMQTGRLREALYDVVAEHEILRTTFHCLPGMEVPLQVIGETPELELHESELRGTSANWRGQLRRELGEQRQKPFAIDNGPLVRFTLLDMAEHRRALLISLPALCADPLTLANLMTHIAAAYARRAGEETTGDEAVQYVDFSEWQGSLSEEAGEDQRFWRLRELGRWSDPLEELQVAPGTAPLETRTLRRPLAKGTARLDAVAAEHGTTAETVLLACWYGLIHRLSHRKEILIGRLSEGRAIEQLRPALGPFARYLPTLCRLEADFELREVLAVVAEEVAATTAQQEQLALADHQVAFLPIVFDLWQPPESLERAGVHFAMLELASALDLFKLRLAAVRRDGALDLELHYDPACYAQATIARLADQYVTLLASALGDPRRSLAQLELLSAAERHQLLVSWNRTGREIPSRATVHSLLAEQAAIFPDRLAVVFEDRALSYRELDRSANRWARLLRRHGVGPESVVALVLERSPELLIGVLGVLKAGGAFAAVDPFQPAERLRLMLEEAATDLVLTRESLSPAMPRGSRLVCLDRARAELDQEPETPPEVAVDPRFLAYVMFTSGSTGRPKGVMIRHRSVVNLAIALDEAIYRDVRSPLRLSLNAPLTFDASIKQLVQLTRGHTLCVVPEEVRPDGVALLSHLAARRVEVLDCTPTQLRLLLEAAGQSSATLPQRILVGGEAVDGELWRRLAADGERRYFNVYGPTECTVDVAAAVIGRETRRPNFGAPLANVRLYVLEGTLYPVPVGTAGELYVAGSGLARGYAGRPELTAERFVPDPFSPQPGGRLYRTGDRVRHTPDGQLEFLGRVDHQVKLRGFRIELGEIEALLGEQPGVAEAAVVLRHDQPDNPRLVAYVVPAREAAPTFAGRRRYLLPNGLAIVHQNRNETDYLYEEIFNKRCYARHGIRLRDDAVVCDVGANIGMFSLFVARHRPRARIYAFEPLAPLYETLRLNAELYLPNTQLLPFGLSDRDASERFTFYPQYTMMSGRSAYARPESEVEVIKRFLENVRQSGPAGEAAVLLEKADELLAGRFEGETQEVRLRRLSDVLREQGIARVDLLKIDVQRAELDVLRGLDDADWERVDQVVMEVHDAVGEATEGRVGEITVLLESRGFAVIAEQDELLVGTDRFNLYARRSDRPSVGDELEATPPLAAGPAVVELSAADLRERLRERLPEPMVPGALVLLPELPLTRHGKVDRQALPAPEELTSAEGADFVAPRTPFEEVLAALWADLLGRQRVGANAHFFDLGGHSLLATQLASRVRETFQVAIPLRAIFDHPTVAGLAAHVEAALRAGRESSAPPLAPALRDGDLPLSFAQQRLWFLQHLQPETDSYNSPMAIRLEGRLDVAALGGVLDEVVRRHEVLRTRFPAEHGQPRQMIDPPAPVPLGLVDLTVLPGARRRREARRLARRTARRPFDLAREHPLRAVLVRLGGEEHELPAVLHHVACDAWSLGVLAREVAALYRAFAAAPATRAVTSPLPELEIQYADFAVWQRQWLRGEALAAELAYWRERLAGAPPVLELLTDRPRPSLPSYRGAELAWTLPPQLRGRLEKLGQRGGATLFMVLLAAFQVLLRRYSGRSDVSVGTPIVGRQHLLTEGLIGFFVNTLVMRSQGLDDPGFGEFLAQVREVALEAYAHQSLPFEKLVDELKPERSLTHTPLFQVMFSLQNAPQETLDLPGLKIRPVPVESLSAKFELVLVLTERDGALAGNMEYSAELFDATTAGRLAQHYHAVLAGAVADPDRRLGELELFTAAQRHQMLVDWNDTAAGVEGDFLVHELCERWAQLTPEAPAAMFAEGPLSYAELERRSGRLARVLRRLGVAPEVRVGVFLDRSPELLAALLAILRAGGAYVPLDPAYPPARGAFMLKDSGAMLLLTEDRLRGAVPGFAGRVVTLDTEELEVGTVVAWPPVRSENLAYVIYTSGSTGQPKGVAVCHSGLRNLVTWHHRVYGVTPQDRATQVASLGFDASVWEIWPYLSAGACLYFPPRESPAELLRELVENRITLSFLPTPLAEATLQQTLPPGLVLRVLLTGGDKLHRTSAADLPLQLVNHYGPTESSVVATASPVAAGPGAPPIGRPIANVQVHVLGRKGEPVPVGAAGELHIGGASLARGYVGDPRATAEKFVPDPISGVLCALRAGSRLYRSGDLVRRLAAGEVDFLGRIDHQVKIRGFRIELGEIEAVLGEHPAVAAAAAVVREERVGSRSLWAFVVAADGPAPPAGELREFLAARLPEYMVPSRIVMLAELPLTASGKVERSTLNRLEAPSAAAERCFAPPRTEVEQTLAGIWRQVLRLDQVGVHDHFFELGGDSILSIQIVARAGEAGLRITPRQIFLHPTIAELAAVTRSGRGDDAEQGLVTGPVPLTPIQRWFVEAPHARPEHWNQAVLLEIHRPLPPAALAAAFAGLLAHHDVLRLRLVRAAGGWRQEIAGLPAEPPWLGIDLSRLPPTARVRGLEAAAARVQASLDLERGPLLRCVLFGLGGGEPDRLLVVIHHLAVDGVSWRIILDDLVQACEQVSRGEPLRLPAKTTSFKAWAELLAEEAGSRVLEDELLYWLDAARAEARPLPVDLPGKRTGALSSSTRAVSCSLDPAATRALLREVPAAYRTEINDVLLTALVRALGSWTGRASLLLALEGHGREVGPREKRSADVDLSRTVGWFTTVFPVLLDARGLAGPGEALKAIKEQLRAVPGRGFGYGLLRYLGAAEVAARLADLPAPEVSFNYLGQLDPALPEDGWLRPARESAGPALDSAEPRRHLLDFSGWVADGRLQLALHYSRDVYRHATVETLLAGFLEELRGLIEHCSSEAAGGRTPSDFPLLALAPVPLERALAEVGFEGATAGPRNVEDAYPLSPMQEGMLHHSAAAPSSGVYVVQVAGTLEELDREAFERAWRRLLERHPVLRTAFAWKTPPQPLQVVGRRVDLPFELFDWRDFSPEEQEAQLTAHLAADRRRGFDLSQAPLLRLALMRTGERAYIFVWSFHHLLFDGWSTPLLLHELVTSYEAWRHGREPLLPARPSYRDFIAWLQDQDPAAADAFWRQTLAGFGTATPLTMLAGEPGASRQRLGFGHLRSTLGEAESHRLYSFAQRAGITVNTAVQGAWALLLSRCSGESDVLFGATTAGRPPELPGSEVAVGLYINTMPVRVRVEPRTAVEEWLRELQDQQARQREFEQTPLVRVQQASGIPGGLPLFESLLVFENYPEDTVAQEGASRLGWRRVSSFEQTNYPLNLIAVDGEPLTLSLGYDRRRLDRTAGRRLLVQMARLLAGFAAGRPLEQLSLLSPTQEQQLRVEWNDTAAPQPAAGLVHLLFEAQAARQPAAAAALLESERISFGELDDRANRLARHLRAAGVGPETRVAICVERSFEMLIALLGVLKAGGAYVPMDPTYPQDRLAFMLADSGASVLLTQERLQSRLPAPGATQVLLDAQWDEIAAARAAPAGPGPGPENLAYVNYTSGSTGRPKGVMVRHGALCNLAASLARRYRLRPGERHLQFMSLGFDASGEEIYPALVSGGTLVLLRDVLGRSPGELLAECGRLGTARLELPAPYWHQLVDELETSGSRVPESVRLLAVGGESPSADKLRAWWRHSPHPLQVFNVYGPTETTITAAMYAVPAAAEPWRVPMGRAIPNAEVLLLDRALRPVPIAVPGMLHVGGAGVARGYLRQPRLTAERFVPHPFSRRPGSRLYVTGDLARHREDGNLEFVGRVDRQVKISGRRLELGEIEENLCQHAELAAAVVRPWRGPTGDTRLAAYVVPRRQGRAAVADLRAFLAARLPSFMVPGAWTVLPALPLTANGKIDDDGLPEPRWERPGAVTAQALRSPVEEIVAEVWSAVLGTGRPSIHDNFFQLGGHSLLATQVVSRLRRIFSLELPLTDVFETADLADLAARIEAALRDGESLRPPSLEPRPRVHGLSGNAAELSYAQQRLWFLDRLLAGSSAMYNIPLALELIGHLDVAALHAVFGAVLRRHEVLRTRFPEVNGQPVQEILPPLAAELPVVDLSALGGRTRRARLQRLASEEAWRRFDLAAGPVLRTMLVRLQARHHALLLTVHHIAADGWSVGLLVREASALYQAFLRGAPSPLAPLPIQYADFASWQRAWLRDEVLAAQIEYWRRQLGPRPTVAELPTDRPRPAVMTFRGARCAVRLPRPLVRQLDAVAQGGGATLFMVLLAGLQALLARLTGQDDIRVGTPIAGRHRAETEGLIGFFINTLVMRVETSGNPGFRRLLARVRQAALGAYAHQDLPFEKVVDALQPTRELSHHPLFSVMFSLQNVPEESLDLPGLEVRDLPLANPAAKFELTLVLAVEDGALAGTLEYNADLFDATTARRMVQYFRALLASAVADGERRLAELEILSAPQRHQMLVAWNDTAAEVDHDVPVHQLFLSWARRAPEAPAAVFADGPLTYGELERRSRLLANALCRLGVAPETRVGVCLERSAELLVALVGILRAGGAYVPLDPGYPPQRRAFALEDSGAELLVTSQELIGDLPDFGGRVMTPDGPELAADAGPEPGAPAPSLCGHHLAYVIYTSGSTGQPKGVAVCHRGLSNLVAWHQRVYRVTASDRATQVASLAFDASVWEIWPYLTAGACLCFPRLDAPEELMAWMAEAGVTLAFLPTPLAEATLQLPLPPGLVLRALLTGGDKLHRAAPRDLPFRLVNHYGPTESSVVATWARLSAGGSGAPPIGRPIANVRAQVLSRYGEPVAVGVSGELCIGGESLARGYLGRPGATAEKFVPDSRRAGVPGARWYRSGDLVRWLADGNLEFLGRIDHQVKIRGFRIELGEIEAVLAEHPAVAAAAVLAREERAGTRGLRAFVVAAGTAPAAEELRRYLAARLPEHMVPARIQTLAELPLTANGKVDRAALDRLSPPPAVGDGFAAPRGDFEMILADIWRQALRRDRVGLDDNFFALGGDSILSIQVVSRARRAGLELTVRQIFEHPTLGELAAVARRARGRAADQGQVSGPVPLTPIQQWFFERLPPAPHHFNQALFLEVRRELRPSLLAASLGHLLRHHDALRLRFPRRRDGTWHQEHARTVAAEGGVFCRIDLSALPVARRRPCCEAAAAMVQASLDLTAGPLLRAASFDLGTGEPDRLLLAAHHLVVDGVSWRILLEDLQLACESLSRRETIRLPLKTTSFQEWAERLAARARSTESDAELTLWRTALAGPVPLLPVDWPDGENTLGSVQAVTFLLDEEETVALVREVPTAYRTTLEEVLLTALVMAFETLTGERRLLVDLEGHGREEIFDEVDVSRTVGWFTTLSPVLLDLSAATSPAAAVKSVTERLRSFPHKGIGYGLLRYLGSSAAAAELGALPRPQVGFNYLGQLDQGMPAETAFAPAAESRGPDQDPRGSQPHLLEVSGRIFGGRLSMDFHYGANVFRRSRIEQLARAFGAELRALVVHCSSPATRGRTASDFPLARLGEEEVDDVFAELEFEGWDAGNADDTWQDAGAEEG